jgi:AcrR family transcriptional regulator
MLSHLNQKEQDRELRRNFLLEAAGRVFGRKPYEEASMGEIADEAQIGVQGFYEYFPSKQALYEELLVSRAQEFQASARDVAEAGLPPEEEIRALTFALVRHFHDHPSALPVFVRSRADFDWEMESRMPSALSIYEAGRVQLHRCIAKLADSGLLRPLPLEFMTELYLDVLQACLQFNFRHRNNEEVHVCVGRALECFLHGTGEWSIHQDPPRPRQ